VIEMNDLDEKIKEELRRSAEAFEPAQGVSLPRVRHRAQVLRVRTLVAVLVAALFLASAAFIATRLPTRTKKGSFIQPSKTTGQDPNYMITAAIAKRLADDALIPPGSTATGPMANSNLAPEMLLGNSHFIDVARYWNVPTPLRETAMWITRHPPARYRYASSTRGVNSRSIAWYLPDDTSQAYEDRAIQYSMVTARGNHTLMRVDGTALWLSSKPVADSLGGPKVRVTIAGGCPRAIGAYHDITNPASEDLKTQMIPTAEPKAGLICRYVTRDPGSTFPLEKVTPKTALGSNSARKLAIQLRTLKVGFDGGGIGSCPLAVGGRLNEIVVFSYPGRPDVDLWFGINCRTFVVNGFVRAGAPITP
jgi:hypothetical protein